MSETIDLRCPHCRQWRRRSNKLAEYRPSTKGVEVKCRTKGCGRIIDLTKLAEEVGEKQ